MKTRKRKAREPETPKFTTPMLERALLGRYAYPKYLTVFDVGNGTGAKCTRRADAIAIGMWPSTSLALEGFELKISRGDYTRELRQPNKSKAISKFCDHWWLVVPKGLVTAAEIPDTWGLIEVTQKTTGFFRTRIAKKAPKLDAEPISRTFLASLMRRSNETTSRLVYPPSPR